MFAHDRASLAERFVVTQIPWGNEQINHEAICVCGPERAGRDGVESFVDLSQDPNQTVGRKLIGQNRDPFASIGQQVDVPGSQQFRREMDACHGLIRKQRMRSNDTENPLRAKIKSSEDFAHDRWCAPQSQRLVHAGLQYELFA